MIKARVVRHGGARFRAAPLARHIAYLERDGVTRDGRDASLFDGRSDAADGDAFAERCKGDRHHFRFIVSPEDGAELGDLRTFARELMDDVAGDLGTRLDWVGVDHWNTDNPHVHLLVRGVADDGRDLVIDRDYIREGMRARAEARATLELGPRSQREIDAALACEVDAERWTSLDRSLQRAADRSGGLLDLRPEAERFADRRRLLLTGRAQKLETLGLAMPAGAGRWTLRADLEETLRALGDRGDIIRTMHRALGRAGQVPDLGAFALHADGAADSIVGRLVERGLHDELAGSAYAIVDGVDGRHHHLKFGDLELTGDAERGAIVELRSWTDRRGAARQALAVRSDLSIEAQIRARGATWLDRQLVSETSSLGSSGLGLEVRAALAEREAHLVEIGFAERRGGRVVVRPQLIATLRDAELREAAGRLADRTGLAARPSVAGASVAGVYRERLDLASGRFAMIDDGMGFQLVPWRPQLERDLGRHVSGTLTPGGGVDWTLGRSRGLGI